MEPLSNIPTTLKRLIKTYKKDFLSVYNLLEGFKDYLKLMIDIEPSKIKTNNLFNPFYLLTQKEFKEIIEIEREIYNEIHEAEMQRAEEEMNEKEEKWFDSEMGDMNRQTFESDPDNYWNID